MPAQLFSSAIFKMLRRLTNGFNVERLAKISRCDSLSNSQSSALKSDSLFEASTLGCSDGYHESAKIVRFVKLPRRSVAQQFELLPVLATALCCSVTSKRDVRAKNRVSRVLPSYAQIIEGKAL
jgi:hypothetical protein